MIAVQYDLDTDQIWITGEERPYPRRSLIATSFPNGTIGIRLKFSDPSDFKVMTSFANLVDGTGNGFATQEAAQAYLDAAFAHSRLNQPGPRAPGIFTGPGSPDLTIGLTGDLYIDAISGDLFSKGD